LVQYTIFRADEIVAIVAMIAVMTIVTMIAVMTIVTMIAVKTIVKMIAVMTIVTIVGVSFHWKRDILGIRENVVSPGVCWHKGPCPP
jgi:hypothetical protein